MANPQKENGYTSISNELMEALARTRISGEQRQLLDFILRKTYGYNKKEDKISLSQFVLGTGLKKPNICRGLKSLEAMNIIIKSDNAKANIYGILKNYDKWKPLSKKITKGRILNNRISIDDIKKEIRNRDNNTCLCCLYNGNLTKENLPVHHIDFNQTNNDNNNLITLCKSCHGKAHNNNEEYKEYLINLIINNDNNKTLSKKIIPMFKNDNPSLSKVIPTITTTTKAINTITSISDKTSQLQIKEVFKRFYDLGNKGINFGNKTERSAAEWLVKQYGLEKTLNTIDYAMSLTGVQYAPIITTPFQLKNNMVKLIAFYKREQTPKKGVVPEFKLI